MENNQVLQLVILDENGKGGMRSLPEGPVIDGKWWPAHQAIMNYRPITFDAYASEDSQDAEVEVSSDTQPLLTLTLRPGTSLRVQIGAKHLHVGLCVGEENARAWIDETQKQIHAKKT